MLWMLVPVNGPAGELEKKLNLVVSKQLTDISPIERFVYNWDKLWQIRRRRRRRRRSSAGPVVGYGQSRR